MGVDTYKLDNERIQANSKAVKTTTMQTVHQMQCSAVFPGSSEKLTVHRNTKDGMFHCPKCNIYTSKIPKVFQSHTRGCKPGVIRISSRQRKAVKVEHTSDDEEASSDVNMQDADSAEEEDDDEDEDSSSDELEDDEDQMVTDASASTQFRSPRLKPKQEPIVESIAPYATKQEAEEDAFPPPPPPAFSAGPDGVQSQLPSPPPSSTETEHQSSIAPSVTSIHDVAAMLMANPAPTPSVERSPVFSSPSTPIPLTRTSRHRTIISEPSSPRPDTPQDQATSAYSSTIPKDILSNSVPISRRPRSVSTSQEQDANTMPPVPEDGDQTQISLTNDIPPVDHTPQNLTSSSFSSPPEVPTQPVVSVSMMSPPPQNQVSESKASRIIPPAIIDFFTTIDDTEPLDHLIDIFIESGFTTKMRLNILSKNPSSFKADFMKKANLAEWLLIEDALLRRLESISK
ncbi:hypothetical protein ABKN59_003431 [Abortiporus biennis]